MFALADQQPALRVLPVLNRLRRDMMADKPDGARGRDDKDLHDGPDTPSQGRSSGQVTVRKRRQRLAPKVSDASSSDGSSDATEPRITKYAMGEKARICASATPGIPKMKLL